MEIADTDSKQDIKDLQIKMVLPSGNDEISLWYQYIVHNALFITSRRKK